ncbi:MAG TPA: hypothetical protein VFN85_06175 [Solirubrobacterales bacterium]|nr:hypothetical protein [Solirubrobacterales bacterium]
MALVSLGAFAQLGQAETVVHPFLPNRFPPPKNQNGEPVSPTPLPEHALTGYFSTDGSFADPCGLAVDPSGAIYTSDYYHDDIDIFDSSGNTYEGHVAEVAPGNGPCGLSLGPEGSLYANVWHASVVRTKPSEGGAWSEPIELIDSHGSTGVAVDPGDGRVYVDDSSYVAVYEPSGEPVLVGGEPMKIGVGSLGRGFGVAVSNFAPTDGRVYVPDAASDTIKVFDPAVSLNDPIQEIAGGDTPDGRFVQLEDAAIALEQSSGHLFLAEQLVAHSHNPPAVVYEFDRFGNYRGSLPHSLVSGVPTGIAIDESSGSTRGDIYVTTGNEVDGGVYAFGPAPPTSALEVGKTGTGGGLVESEPDGIDCGPTCASEFKTGLQVKLTALPDAHSAFVGWLVNGAASPTCSGTGKCAVELKADTDVSARFERLPQHLLTVTRAGSGAGTVTSEPAAIDCGSTCAEEVGEGLIVTLTAVAEPHSTFTGWTVAGEPSACPGTGTCQVQMNSDTEVTATFAAIPQRSLEIAKTGSGTGAVSSEPAGIDCGPTCAFDFDAGTTVTLFATADPGSVFAGWSGGGCSGTGSCQVSLGESRGVEAQFDEALHQVTVTVGGSGGGEVVSSPAGISCGGNCSQRFAEGTAVTLTAQPAPGSTFAGWSGACTGRRLCQIVLRQDAAVSAEFRPTRHTLAVVVSGTGNGTVTDSPLGISCGLACSGVYDQGTVATLVAEAARGSTFTGWQSCPQPSGNHCVAPLGADETIGASFRELATLDLSRALIRRTTAILEADISSPGTLVVSGKRVKRLTLKVNGEAPATLRVHLTRASKRRLARRGRLKVRISVTFKPVDGSAPVIARRSLIFTTNRGKR